MNIIPTVSNSKFPEMYQMVSNLGKIKIVFTEQTSKGTFIRKNNELVKVLKMEKKLIIKIHGIRF